MTTVGYGDMVPHDFWGKIDDATCVISCRDGRVWIINGFLLRSLLINFFRQNCRLAVCDCWRAHIIAASSCDCVQLQLLLSPRNGQLQSQSNQPEPCHFVSVSAGHGRRR